MAKMAVSWAWARSRFHRSGSGSSGGSLYGSAIGSALGSLRSMSFQSSGGNSLSGNSFSTNASTNGTTRSSRHRIRVWSRPTCLEDVLDELEKQTSADRGVLIHTEDRGFTEHVNAFAAIQYLRCLLRERRQPNLPLGHRRASASMPVRRRQRSASPAPLVLDPKELSGLSGIRKCATVGGELCSTDGVVRIPSVVTEEEEREVCSAEVPSDAETCLPSDDEHKPGKDERLKDLQLVLDAASPSECVGLDVILGGDHGTVKAYSAEGGFVVALKSGADVSLARIDASHVLGCLPEWA